MLSFIMPEDPKQIIVRPEEDLAFEVPEGQDPQDFLRPILDRVSHSPLVRVICLTVALTIAGCATLRTKATGPQADNKAGITAPNNPGEAKFEATPYDFTPEKAAAYENALAQAVKVKLETELQKLKEPDRVLRILAKYQIPLQENDQLEGFVQEINIASEAIEFYMDTLATQFGLKLDRTFLLETIKTLQIAEVISRISLSSMMSMQKLDLENPEVYKAFDKATQGILKKICKPEVKKFFQELSQRTGEKFAIDQAVILYVATGQDLPKTEADWAKFKEALDFLKHKFGDKAAKNAMTLALAFFADPNIQQNLDELDKQQVTYELTQDLSLDDLSLLADNPLDPKYLAYMKWYSDNFGIKWTLQGMAISNVDFERFKLGELQFDKDLADKVKAASNDINYNGPMGPILYYALNKDGVDKLAKHYEIEVNQEELHGLAEIHKKYIKEGVKFTIKVKGQEKEVTFNPYNKAQAALVNMFYKFKSKGYLDEKPDPKGEMRKLDKSFEAAVASLKLLPFEQLRILIFFAQDGELKLDPIFFDPESLGPLLKSVGEGGKAAQSILAIHRAFGIEGGMSLDEITTLFNKEAETQNIFYGWGKVLKPIFQDIGLDMSVENIEEFFSNEGFAARVFPALYNVDQHTPNHKLINKIKFLKKAFDVKELSVKKLLFFINIAQSYTELTKADLVKLAKLYLKFKSDTDEYKHTDQLDTFLSTLNIYMNDQANRAQVFADVTNPQLHKKVEKVMQKYSVDCEASELFSLSHKQDQLDLLLSPEFEAWISIVLAKFSLKIEDFRSLTIIATRYQNEELRQFLASQPAWDFAAAQKSKGKEYAIYTLDDLYQDYQNRDILQYVDILKKNFGIDLNKEDVGSAALLAGHQVSPQELLKNLERNGFLEKLKDPSTMKRAGELKSKLGIVIDKNSLLAFLQINNNDELYNKLLSPKFIEFCKKIEEVLELKFAIELTDTFMDLFESGDPFAVVEGLQVGITSIDDIDALTLITKTPGLFSGLRTAAFKDTVESTKQKAGEHVLDGFSDLLTLYKFEQEGFKVDDLYTPDFEDFIQKVTQSTSKSIQYRKALYPYFKDPLKKTKLLDPKFRAIAAKVNPSFGSQFSRIHADDIETILFFMENEGLLQKFLHHNSGKFMAMMLPGMGEDSALILDSVLPSFKLLETDVKVKEYRDLMEKELPYRASLSDGFAIKMLTERYPDLAIFQAKLAELKQKLISSGFKYNQEQGFWQSDKINLNDLLLLFTHENFSFDRTQLEADLSTGFTRDLHRQDTNFFSYDSYNDPKKLNIFELNKTAQLRHALQSDASLRAQIGENIVKDIEQATTTELGGLTVCSPDGSVEFQYYKSNNDVSNGAYQMPQVVNDRGTQSCTSFHQHATKYSSGNYASPSGSVFHRGGDITVAELFKTDGIVITSLAEKSESTAGEFAVHFYTEKKDVIFLGVYEY